VGQGVALRSCNSCAVLCCAVLCCALLLQTIAERQAAEAAEAAAEEEKQQRLNERQVSAVCGTKSGCCSLV
jgi:hypothetical protein